MWPGAHVVHRTEKQIIWSRRNDEDGCEIYKNEKCLHVQSYRFSWLNMQIRRRCRGHLRGCFKDGTY